MTEHMSGIIRASKLTLRCWRDVHNRMHLACVTGCQERLLLYLQPSTCNTSAQKRWASSAKVFAKRRISKADILATAAAGLRRRSSLLLLRTLNQDQLYAGDFVDLSGKVAKTVHFSLAPAEARLEMQYFYSDGRRNIPFPPDCQGFFYWHHDPDAPPVSGQVRFRTTTSSDPATFPSGRDLQLPDGQAWNIALFDIALRAKYAGLRAHLLSQSLVTAEVLDIALNISARNGKRIYHPATGSLLLWKFGQRFLVDLPSLQETIWVIGSSAGERLRLPSLSSVCVRESETTEICYVLSEGSGLHTSQQTGKRDFLEGVDHTPFTGRALVQFERSTLPEHKGTRTVVLRILRVMTKPDSSDEASWMPEPQEDSLDMTEIHQHSWSWNVDQPQYSRSLGPLAKALRILFDNEASPRASRPKSYA
ncbi:hypothetical protein OE88DRAFT_410255 [Heliocybe sulcata]|uniref:Uncharacterized protein n=1 Tax=Heliocybe sulcata TaxID=5364 RepID=A0A5C3MYQ3_9AGAM|nr:hypothetical protein OE88DRAFT_410255 [Heliocybe sulcata]